MFVKLSRQSASWWLCVIVSSGLAACLLTILVYPAYAALCDGACTDGDCGDAPPPDNCAACDDEFDRWEFRSEVDFIRKWNDNGTCKAELITFHKATAHNNTVKPSYVDYQYKGIIMHKEGCARSVTPPATEGRLNVPGGHTRTNTYYRSTNYILDTDTSNCSYKGQAVTEWVFKGGPNGDWQSTCGQFRLGKEGSPSCDR